jgi:hypothetical protein
MDSRTYTIRCMGPWPACGHAADNRCTAGPVYQSAIAEKKPTPAPEGEVVAWRWKTLGQWAYTDRPERLEMVRSLGESPEPLYASPVVPVGREEIARIIDPDVWANLGMRRRMGYDTERDTRSSLRKADAILAALGTKGADTGWRDIATAPRQEPVIVGHEKLKGWRRQAICNALGEWSFYDRPWLQQDPLDEAPTHWLAWPDGIPTDTGSEV